MDTLRGDGPFVRWEGIAGFDLKGGESVAREFSGGRRVHPPTAHTPIPPKPKFNFNINLLIINIILYFVKF